MLEIKNLSVSYGAINALHGISLSVKPGSIVTLIGANGAGKTTTLKTISGLLKPKSGEIFYDGQNIAGLPTHQIVARGLSHVPEGRMIFANLTVLENLQLGAYLQKDKKIIRHELEHVFSLFPRLKEREKQNENAFAESKFGPAQVACLDQRIDADGAVLGRLAVQVADILRGKNKPVYTPHLDAGDFVIVINAEKVRVTGKKETAKEYMSYSGWKGGEKYATVAQVRAKQPERSSNTPSKA
jgi:ABC-type ATPase involved in cell division